MKYKKGDEVYHKSLKKCVVIRDSGNGMVDVVDPVMFERGVTQPSISVSKDEVININKRRKYFKMEVDNGKESACG